MELNEISISAPDSNGDIAKDSTESCKDIRKQNERTASPRCLAIPELDEISVEGQDEETFTPVPNDDIGVTKTSKDIKNKIEGTAPPRCLAIPELDEISTDVQDEEIYTSDLNGYITSGVTETCKDIKNKIEGTAPPRCLAIPELDDISVEGQDEEISTPAPNDDIANEITKTSKDISFIDNDEEDNKEDNTSISTQSFNDDNSIIDEHEKYIDETVKSAYVDEEKSSKTEQTNNVKFDTQDFAFIEKYKRLNQGLCDDMKKKIETLKNDAEENDEKRDKVCSLLDSKYTIASTLTTEQPSLLLQAKE